MKKVKRVREFDADYILPRLYSSPNSSDRVYLDAVCHRFGKGKCRIAIHTRVFYNGKIDSVFSLSAQCVPMVYDYQTKRYKKLPHYNTGAVHWLFWEVCPDLRWLGILARNDKTRQKPSESKERYAVRKAFYEELLEDFGL